jgi:hypothetical protein
VKQGPYERTVTTRQVISAAKLYAILDREFRKRRPDACRRCKIPLPFYTDPPDEVSANWHIGTPDECPHKCHAVIGEVLAELWTRYALEDPVDEVN